MLREDLRLAGVWNADGVRAACSPNRRMAMVPHGPKHEQLRKVSIVWAGASLTSTTPSSATTARSHLGYEWLGRSFDNLGFRFLDPIRQHAPDDYERILQWFPLSIWT